MPFQIYTEAATVVA